MQSSHAPAVSTASFTFGRHGQDTPTIYSAFDGRLDNRAELLAQLRDCRFQGEPSDADLLLQGYLKWKLELPKHLLGDFAIVVFDRHERTVLAATDAFGVRSLSYRQEGERIAIGSRSIPAQMFDTSIVNVNTALLATHVAGRPSGWADQSSDRRFRRLAPGTRCLWTDRRQANIDVYYRCCDRAPLVPKREADIVEMFKVLLTEAVKVRLPDRQQCGVELSGGLDSSSVLALAAQLISTGQSHCSLRGFSSVYTRTPEADEKAYMKAVAGGWPWISVDEVPGDDAWLFGQSASQGRVGTDVEPNMPRATLHQRMIQAERRGIGVLLCGTYADQIMGNYTNTELWKALPLRASISEFPHYRKRTRNWIRWFGRLARLEVESRFRVGAAAHAAGRHLRPHAWARHHFLVSGQSQHVLRVLEDWGERYNIEWRLPYLDLRLVEFVLSVPPSMLHRTGIRKWLPRMALRGLLPESVLGRTATGRSTTLYHRALHNEAPTLARWMRSSRAVEMGLTSQRWLESVVGRDGRVSSQSTTAAYRWAMTEWWLRSIE